jgi:hypothetical protein
MMLITLGVLSVIPLIIMGKFDPMAFFDSSLSKGASEFSKLEARAPKNLSSVVTDKKVQVYKWRDEKGVMQFSNVAPPTDRNAERVELDPDSNLMQAVKVPEKTPEKAAPKKVTQTKLPNLYSVKGAKKLMDKTRDVEELLKQRHEQQQEAINNL